MCRLCLQLSYKMNIHWTFFPTSTFLYEVYISIQFYVILHIVLYWHDDISIYLYMLKFSFWIFFCFEVSSFFFFKNDWNLLLLFSHAKLASSFEHHDEWMYKVDKLGHKPAYTTAFYFVKHQTSGTNKHHIHNWIEEEEKSVHSFNTVCCLYDY